MQPNGYPPPPVAPTGLQASASSPTVASGPFPPPPGLQSGLAFPNAPPVIQNSMGGAMPNFGFQPMMDSSMLAAMTNPKLLAAMSNMFITRPGAPGNTTGRPNQSSGDSNETLAKDGGDQAWKEFKTNEGRIFWHNAKTNKSTWDKPDDLKDDVEKILATSTMWREYPGGDGKTYWHNLDTKQSEWEVPKEVADILEEIRKLEKEDWTEKKFDGKTQAKITFKEFLGSRGIGYLAKWEDVGKILQKDVKWKAFDGLLTTGERKHIFNEYVDQLQKKTREEQRLRKAAARDALSDFLNKWRQGESGPAMPPDVTFEDLRKKAQTQTWWHFLTVRDQSEAFEEVAQQVLHQTSHKTAREVVEQWVKFFGLFIEAELSLNSTPAEVVEFAQSFLPDDQLATVHSTVMMTAWTQALSRYLEANQENMEKQRAQLEVLGRKDFKNLLRDAEAEGLIDAKTEWVDFVNGPTPKKPADSEPCQPLSERDAKQLEKVAKRVREWIQLENSSNGPSMRDEAANRREWISEGDQPRSLSEEHGSSEDRRQNPDESDDSSNDKRVCEDVRYLRLFLQGGSTARELFDDLVFELWDAYEELRSVVKDILEPESPLTAKLAQPVLPSIEDFENCLRQHEKVSKDLLDRTCRPGVLRPLIFSLTKRVKKSWKADPCHSPTNKDPSPEESGTDFVQKIPLEEDTEEGQLKSRSAHA